MAEVGKDSPVPVPVPELLVGVRREDEGVERNMSVVAEEVEVSLIG